jgi:chitinase
VASENTGLPTKISGGYWVYWGSPARLRDINPNYDLIYLFHAVPEGGSPGTTGAVVWNTPNNSRGAATYFKTDLQYVRSTQGKKVLLTVGGAGASMSFPTRTKSQNFVNSIVSLYNQFGGFDGLDWNTFEADQAPDTAEMIWISKELKRLYPGFLITAPPAPWNQRDKNFCKDMLTAGALDYCAPQYYDGPGLNDPSYIINSVNEWVNLLGAKHLVVGFGHNTTGYYMTADQILYTWNQIYAQHPNIQGAFNWEIQSDETLGYAYANKVGAAVRSTSTSTNPPVAPGTVSISVGSITASTLSMNWTKPTGTVTGYRIGWTSSSGLPQPAWSDVYTLPSNPFVFTNLAPSTSYNFWIEALNGTSTGPRTTFTISTTN